MSSPWLGVLSSETRLHGAFQDCDWPACGRTELSSTSVGAGQPRWTT